MSEPIRILHMIGSLNIGGSQSMVINLHRAIDRTKVQFDYVIDHPGQLYYEDVVKQLGGKIFEMPTFKGTNLLEIRKSWKKFFKDHPEYKVLHSHVRSYASLYLPIAHKAGLKTIIHSHSTSNGNGLLSVVKRIMQYPLRYQADDFFACSKEAGAWLFGKRVVEGNSFHILQNAIDVDKYRFNQKIRDEYREKLGLENKKTFIHVGRFHPAKNHVFLLNLFADIHRKDDNSVLLLVGDGELRSVIEQQISALNIQDSVILLGSRSDVPNLLQAADCFLFPSVWEGLPVTVVEAQAAGLPCLVSDRVTKEVGISNVIHYLSVDQGTQSWIASLEKISLIRKDVSGQISEAGFDIRFTASRLADFYKEVANA